MFSCSHHLIRIVVNTCDDSLRFILLCKTLENLASNLQECDVVKQFISMENQPKLCGKFIMDFVTTQQHNDKLMTSSSDSFELACKLLYLICQQLHQSY